MVRLQREDGELGQLFQLLMKPLEERGEVRNYPELQKFVRVWDQLQIQDQLLVQVPPRNSDAADKVQVVLPKCLVPKVLAMLHNVVTGGHLGVQKLQGKVKDRFYWPGWFADVRRWCSECSDCGSRKLLARTPQAPMHPSVTSRPYEHVALDILGPLSETIDKNLYILVVGDYFSKWTEAFALPNQEARSVAKVLVEEWVCRYGVPRSLHSDQGRNFESTLFQELCRLLEINKTRTSPYHPQSDGLIERFNRTLLSMLSIFVDKNQQNCDSLLPYVMMAYRSSVHATTGFTPHKVVFGREMVLPVDIMLNVNLEEAFVSPSEYVQRMAEILSTVVGAVQQHQLQASAQQAQLQSVDGGPTMVIHYNRLKPYVSEFVSEKREGNDETVQPPLQRLVDPSTPQRVPPVVAERPPSAEGRSCFGGTKEGNLQHGSSLPPARSRLEYSPGLTVEPLYDGGGPAQIITTPSAEVVGPPRQRKLPVWTKDYHLDSRTSSSGLEGE
ncbi:protein NYNRIN-like [Xyrauchen texanus]|uniref:protein NYNRIN-like n=1 Tax=Xyrauchen texanus TaxID=154827 RepID=UPI0022426CE6|nr:protein NYNRIN-like [Xyrauchen texanus]